MILEEKQLKQRRHGGAENVRSEKNLTKKEDLIWCMIKLTWKKKCMNKNIEIKDSTGVIVNEPEEVREQWRLYIESLYDKD